VSRFTIDAPRFECSTHEVVLSVALCAAGCWLANLLALLSKHGVAPELWRFDAVTAAGLRARAADEQGRRVASARTPTHLGSWAGRRRR